MSATNSHMYGAATGNAVAVTPGGNVNTTTVYDKIVNVGRVVLRNNAAFQLPDIQASWVKIRTSSTNVSNVWLGGIADHQAQDNMGHPLVPGSSILLPCTNANQWSLFPTYDGDTVYIIVGGVGNASNITPGSPGVLDVTAPSIISEIPTAGVSGQPINTPISALADRPLDPTSINTTNITITPTPAGFSPTVDSTNPANILMLYTGNLASNTVHTVNINGLKNVNGYTQTVAKNYTFTTSNTTTPPSNTPPTITATNPTSGATGVATSINPTITFSQPMLASSFTTNSIKITDLSGPTFLTGYTFSLSGDLKTLTINGLGLDNSKQYRIDVYNTATPGSGVQNTVGIYLDNTYSITFTTVAPTVQVYNVAGTSGTYSSMNGTNFYQMVGIYVNTTASKLLNKVPRSVSYILKRVGNPPGSLVCQIDQINSGGTQTFVRSFGSVPASSVGTTDTVITFTNNTNPNSLIFNRSMSLYYQSGDSSNYIMAKCSSTDAFDGNATCLLRTLATSSTVATVQTIDLAGTINVEP